MFLTIERGKPKRCLKMSTKRRNIFMSLLPAMLLLSSCMQTNTSDAKETFRYWAGTDAPADLELLNGQYWQSQHFSKEYIMYLKFKPTQDWWNKYVNFNSISEDQGSWNFPNDAPTWFYPSKNSVRYGRGDELDQDSRYFRDSLTGICYIYEVQQ
jgi:hypothetical protein